MSHILLAGSSGLLGTVLGASLEAQGHIVRRLVRRKTGVPNEILWNPSRGELPPAALQGCDAAINLSGAPISSRWSPGNRSRIVDSRMQSTRLLANACSHHGVGVLINASATGIFGHRGEEVLDESSLPGSGFLATTCMAWEGALTPSPGVRTVACRFGILLSASGGAMAAMLPAFKLGLGGPLGTGAQWMPWIHLADAVAVVEHALATASLSGPILATSLHPARQAEFARALGHSLHRPARLRTPAWILRLVFGAMADELLLGSQHCLPHRLESTGFVWAFPHLQPALDDLVARRASL